jgi:hypothetical protein
MIDSSKEHRSAMGWLAEAYSGKEASWEKRLACLEQAECRTWAWALAAVRVMACDPAAELAIAAGSELVGSLALVGKLALEDGASLAHRLAIASRVRVEACQAAELSAVRRATCWNRRNATGQSHVLMVGPWVLQSNWTSIPKVSKRKLVGPSSPCIHGSHRCSQSHGSVRSN